MVSSAIEMRALADVIGALIYGILYVSPFPPEDDSLLTFAALLHRLPPHLPGNSRLVTYVLPYSSVVGLLTT